MLYLVCTIISSTLHVTEYLVLKTGYMWLVVQVKLTYRVWATFIKCNSTPSINAKKTYIYILKYVVEYVCLHKTKKTHSVCYFVSMLV